MLAIALMLNWHPLKLQQAPSRMRASTVARASVAAPVRPSAGGLMQAAATLGVSRPVTIAGSVRATPLIPPAPRTKVRLERNKPGTV